ncbi:MAG: T9SS type A sorting domain-containing protein [Bacteroidales bacterium]|nr:T9SS type A sorting domain-containing protein [Bacteroidales bacterium]
MNTNLITKYCKKALILISVLILDLGFLKADSENPLEILFIGSSYFGFNDLPGLFENLALKTEKDIYIDNYNPGGLYLADHASSSITEAKINERNWDYVILQGVGALMAYPDYYTHHPVYPALVTLKDKINKNCVSTKIIFCLPWAFEDGMTWVEGWTDTYEDMQNIIYNNTIQYSNCIGFTIAPVGWAWYKVLDEKDYPLHYLHISDWNHPSLKGSYLMACVIYSTIFMESTLDIPYYTSLEEDEATYFQTVASNTVLNDIDLWNITAYIDTTSTGITQFSKLNKAVLYQNFPNPFHSSTQIKYKLHKESIVEIEVFDLLGKKQGFLINEQKQPGSYSVKFDGRNLNNGMYFYSLKTDNFFQIKKMQLIK